jgi:hypothetical protein
MEIISLKIAILLLAVSILCLILLEIKRSRLPKPDKDCGRWSVHPSKRGVFIPSLSFSPLSSLPIARKLTPTEESVLKYAYQLDKFDGHLDIGGNVHVIRNDKGVYCISEDELAELVKQL